MTDERILEIAAATGLSLGLHGPARLIDTGDGSLRFVADPNHTYHALQMINFARAIESEVKSEVDVNDA